MGQKVHPVGFRVGITRGWVSTWFAKRGYADLLHGDLKVREFVKKRLTHAGVSSVEIERASNRARINIWTARPGIIIGKRGSEVDKLKTELQALTGLEAHLQKVDAAVQAEDYEAAKRLLIEVKEGLQRVGATLPKGPTAQSPRQRR